MVRLGLGVVAAILFAGCSKGHPLTAAEKGAVARARLKWSLSTTVEAYKKAGHTNPSWDDSAEAALTEFARAQAGALAPGEEADADSLILNSCSTAVAAGCDDPMIRYLQLRLSWGSYVKAAEAYAKLAPEMEGSAYPKIRKFYVWLRMHQTVTDAYGYGTNVPQEYLQLGAWNQAGSDLCEVLDDPELPPEEAYKACHELLQIWDGSADYYATMYHACEAKFPRGWKNDASILLLKGEANIHFAWDARGGGYSDSVSKEGWKKFADRLEDAEEALTRAWETKPTEAMGAPIAYAMMRVELGQGKGRARLETWFNRAMEANPYYFDACNLKLLYLEPKWYGTPKDMVEFGRECASNTNWLGHVPLILLDAHREILKGLTDESEKANYWKRPEVWQDVKLAFDRFFELNPQETKWYQNYAWYAWQAGAWDELNAAIPKLEDVNYKFFGGKEKFDGMVAEARKHAGGGKGRE